MTSKKWDPIAIERIDLVFNDECIERLTQDLPAGADQEVFGRGVREAASIYARDARLPNANMLNDEIAGLYHAAERQLYVELADRIGCERLSEQARDMLTERGSRIGVELPRQKALSDPERREDACRAILSLCWVGADKVKGRRRPGGKQSRPTWRPLLHAPGKRRHFPRRDAERNFVMWLRVAWVEATGNAPSHTARHKDPGRGLGPFGRIAKECLRLVGAPHADVVELINELDRRRHRMKKLAPAQRAPAIDPFE
jgi:hypothetical protein